MAKIWNLKNRVGWGREFHISTPEDTYAGSGKSLNNKKGIIRKKPTIEEMKTLKLRCQGFSYDYVKDGDILEYETSEGQPFFLKFKNVKYCGDPRDMFFSDLVFYDPNKKSLFKRLIQKLSV